MTDSHSEQDSPAMPAALREHLHSLTWAQPDYRFTCTYMIDGVLSEIAKAGYHLVQGCEHPDGYAYWDCETCVDEAMTRFSKAQEEKALREGKIKHFHMVPYTSEEEAAVIERALAGDAAPGAGEARE